MKTPKLIVFDFDGTLFDTHASIVHCISQTFTQLSPPNTSHPAFSAIRVIIATGAGLSEIFETLHAGPIADMDHWITTYRSFYVSEGLALITAFPYAEVCRLLSQRVFNMLIVRNRSY
jgi:phosphoglycolate phosphatase